MTQGFRLTRERTVAGKKTVEAAYGITTLTGARGPAQALPESTRDHWAIENGSHYVRDVTLREDACRVRSGAAPQGTRGAAERGRPPAQRARGVEPGGRN